MTNRSTFARKLSLAACILFLIFSFSARAQVTTGTFVVNGDINNYYPVTFHDGAWGSGGCTILKLARPDVHLNANWRGSFLAQFDFHVTNWGHGASYINANILRGSAQGTITDFIAGWRDATGSNNTGRIIIWLRGGSTTYKYESNYPVSPVVYDDVQNPLPFVETGTSGGNHTFKTTMDPTVNNNGITSPLRAYFNGTGNHSFNGNVGIGTQTPLEKLHVNQGKHIITSSSNNYGQLQVLNPTDAETSIAIACNGTGLLNSPTAYARQWQIGINTYGSGLNNLAITNPVSQDKGFVFSYDGRMGIGTNKVNDANYRLFVEQGIRTRKVKVDMDTWPDYVFTPGYKLPSLDTVSAFIQTHGHLPEIPSATEVKKEGINLGDNQATLLRKIEELTLYIIDQNKEIQLLKKQMKEIQTTK